jgi:hypothetical protein
VESPENAHVLVLRDTVLLSMKNWSVNSAQADYYACHVRLAENWWECYIVAFYILVS